MRRWHVAAGARRAAERGARAASPARRCVLNVCQAGNELLCAGYTLYSSSTILVLTVGECWRWLEESRGVAALWMPGTSCGRLHSKLWLCAARTPLHLCTAPQGGPRASCS